MITLQLTDLKKSFGPNTVFEHLDLTHSQGPLGIAGSNGSGKSTLLQCIGGLLPPTNGTITWKEQSEVLSSGAIQQRLGYAAPYINLYDELSCLENLSFLANVRLQDYGSNIEEWLQKVGLGGVVDQPFGKISTGQRQRLRLAAALFHQPNILLLDEPGSNLDKSGEQLVKEIALQFSGDNKLLILASNNNQELNLCQKVYSIETQAFL
ncbi:ABC transporter ATP-binding protein [Fodinibius salsisoli]|uniref:ABC transporter ATP-binding protein n=1 Tax=Fodinibius salsisoli TaxID=2820877 RepID=A0ABT3PTF7_9BACT|nr:ABC transporter ATP-binding protein [Fodinibius salsisoli]MCW9709148.1 ABC transporter ATP-binding protein [Fodinibius salsisoli]